MEHGKVITHILPLGKHGTSDYSRPSFRETWNMDKVITHVLPLGKHGKVVTFQNSRLKTYNNL